MKTKKFMLLSVAIILLMTGCQQEERICCLSKQTNIPESKLLNPASQEVVNNRLAIFASFELTSDISHLSDKEKQMLPLLFECADIMQEIYWEQTIGNKDDFLRKITDKKTRQFAKINYGPWDRLNGNK